MNPFIPLSIMALFTGCASNTGTGILSGCTLGATIGGISGGGGGSLIGTAAGILAGGLIGAALDEQDTKVMQQSSPRTVDRMERGEPLTINDVIKLSQGGVSDDTIIN
jgi:outer membrane lipoprotein SlyB